LYDDPAIGDDKVDIGRLGGEYQGVIGIDDGRDIEIRLAYGD
jgi:hypothetical protein